MSTVADADVMAEVETPASKVVITEPGLYPDLSNADYHAQHASLSSSGAKTLLTPGCPALFAWERDNGRADKPHYDFGHAAHREVLGVGEEIVCMDAKFTDWRTKAVKEDAAAARAEGKVPLLAGDYATVKAMAKALREHEWASLLFAPGSGEPEQSMFWEDPDTGVMCRARHDWLRHPNPDGRLLCVDLKTAHSVEPGALRKAAANNGWYMQAPWYVDGVEALGLDGGRGAAFLFVAIAKTPPHLVTVVELDWDALETGRAQNRKAREIFRDCTESGHWPAYASAPITVSLPPWIGRDDELGVTR